MAYSFQTFVANQIFTEGQANQMEQNVRDHVHGRNNVVPLNLSWTQQNKTATFDITAAMNGQFIRAGTSQSSNMVARPLDVASAGEEFAVGILNDNDLQLGVSSVGETGAVLVNSSVAQPITKAGFRDWPVTAGEAGFFLQSSGYWYPYGFAGLHPLVHTTEVISDTMGSYLTAYVSPGYDALFIMTYVSNVKGSDILNLRTRRTGTNSGTYDDELVEVSNTVDTLTTGRTLAALGLFGIAKQDGAQAPYAINITKNLVSTAEAGSANSAVIEQVMVQNSAVTPIGGGSDLFVWGLKRHLVG